MNEGGDEFEAVAGLLRSLCRDDLPLLTPETALDTLPGMDSLKSLQAMALMEGRFGVQINPAALDAPLRTVGDVVAVIRGASPARNAIS